MSAEVATETTQVRMTWGRRLREDARREFADLAAQAGLARHRRRLVWAVEARLLAWTERAEPISDYSGRLLAEDDDGNWLVPAPDRNGEPWWQGRWCWWRPSHWPVYIRSRRANTYVMVEQDWADQ